MKILMFAPISLDNYYVNREDTPVDEDGRPDFEALEAIELDLFLEQLAELERALKSLVQRHPEMSSLIAYTAIVNDIGAGPLHFIALFIFTIGDIVRIAVPVVAALIGAGVVDAPVEWLLFSDFVEEEFRQYYARSSVQRARLLPVFAIVVVLVGIGGKCVYLFEDFIQEFLGGQVCGSFNCTFQAFETEQLLCVVHGFDYTVSIKDDLVSRI